MNIYKIAHKYSRYITLISTYYSGKIILSKSYKKWKGKKWLRLSRIYQVENQWLAILGGYHIVIDLTTAAPSKPLSFCCTTAKN